MIILLFGFGIALVVMVLLDAFETVVLPRTVRRAFRLTNAYFWITWRVYIQVGRMKMVRTRQTILNAFAPLLLLGLVSMWAVTMIIGFALILYGLQVPFSNPGANQDFGTHLYYSGVTFFTLGFGDVVPISGTGRFLAVFEAGLGFGFLALIIGYVPVIYAAFSRREVHMLLLDSKAGSDPTAVELLRRHAEAGAMMQLIPLLQEWERFSAELLESYLSYPMLAFYRSQHDSQNWLRSLTAVLDACAIISGGFHGDPEWERPLMFQARATFAMARHVVVDLAYVLDVEPTDFTEDLRMAADRKEVLYKTLDLAGCALDRTERAMERRKEMRRLYDPFVLGLSRDLVMDLPPMLAQDHHKDNWETTAWDGSKHF